MRGFAGPQSCERTEAVEVDGCFGATRRGCHARRATRDARRVNGHRGLEAHRPPGHACQNPTFPANAHTAPAMDIERINQIGGLLTDLTARTSALRGYL